MTDISLEHFMDEVFDKLGDMRADINDLKERLRDLEDKHEKLDKNLSERLDDLENSHNTALKDIKYLESIVLRIK